ncbi:MAG: hypothetical protein HC831_32285, partial [Chloroflexia bacterium]|nr:hypothetical protein [Chloroflexia bacterium]
MKLLFLLIFCFVANVAFSQTSAVRLIRNEQDLKLATPSDIKKIRYDNFNLSLVLSKNNGTREKIPFDSVWGYTPKDEYEYKATRLYNRIRYRLLQSDEKIFLYFVKPKWYGSRFFITPFFAFYRFSTTFDGKIYKLNKKINRKTTRSKHLLLNLSKVKNISLK